MVNSCIKNGERVVDKFDDDVLLSVTQQRTQMLQISMLITMRRSSLILLTVKDRRDIPDWWYDRTTTQASI